MKREYLLAYNGVQLLGWGLTFVLGVGHMLFGHGTGGAALYDAMGAPLLAFQLLMLLDVAHAAIGLVPSPVATAAMQVASRVLVVCVLFAVPLARTTLLGLLLLLFAWVPTELIRYTYYLLRSLGRRDEAGIPRWLLWLRYSAFVVLYPAGITGELLVLWTSLPQIRAHPHWHPFAYFLIGVFCVYPFGSVVLYRHMLHQRAKSLNPKAKKSA